MITRKKDRFDYEVYHKSGRKVWLGGGGGGDIKSEMDSSHMVLEELKIIEDINHNLSFYDLNGLFTEEEIKEATRIISGLCQSFRHIHVELRTMFGDNYAEKYPKYGVNFDKLTDFIKSAKTKLRNEIQASKMSNETESLKFEFELLNQKIIQINFY